VGKQLSQLFPVVSTACLNAPSFIILTPLSPVSSPLSCFRTAPQEKLEQEKEEQDRLALLAMLEVEFPALRRALEEDWRSNLAQTYVRNVDDLEAVMARREAERQARRAYFDRSLREQGMVKQQLKLRKLKAIRTGKSASGFFENDV
jgi:hypothetical protein